MSDTVYLHDVLSKVSSWERTIPQLSGKWYPLLPLVSELHGQQALPHLTSSSFFCHWLLSFIIIKIVTHYDESMKIVQYQDISWHRIKNPGPKAHYINPPLKVLAKSVSSHPMYIGRKSVRTYMWPLLVAFPRGDCLDGLYSFDSGMSTPSNLPWLATLYGLRYPFNLARGRQCNEMSNNNNTRVDKLLIHHLFRTIKLISIMGFLLNAYLMFKIYCCPPQTYEFRNCWLKGV